MIQTFNIDVTQEDIDLGQACIKTPGKSLRENCAVARAVGRVLLPLFPDGIVRWNYRSGYVYNRFNIPLAEIDIPGELVQGTVRAFVHNHDEGGTVKPFSFSVEVVTHAPNSIG